MSGLEVSRWRPEWGPAGRQLRANAGRLRGLIGHRVVDAWVVWDLERSDWCPELPVVLRFDQGRQLEVSWRPARELSITWNTIDLSVDPTAHAGRRGWRSGFHPALNQVIDDVVVALGPTLPSPSGPTSTSSVAGIWLETGTSGLHILSTGECNALENELPAAVARFPF